MHGSEDECIERVDVDKGSSCGSAIAGTGGCADMCGANGPRGDLDVSIGWAKRRGGGSDGGIGGVCDDVTADVDTRRTIGAGIAPSAIPVSFQRRAADVSGDTAHEGP